MENDINGILAAYSDAVDAPGGARLEEWVLRYPQHKRELVRFAFYRHVVDCAGKCVPDDTEAEARLIARGRAVRERFLTAQPPALVSLLDAARAEGWTVPELAARLHLTPAEFAKLNQRLIRAASLPRRLVRDLAESLGRTFGEVAAYLRLGPTLAQGVSYKADAAPRVGAQEDFAATVAGSRGMTEAQKAAWQVEMDDLLGETEE